MKHILCILLLFSISTLFYIFPPHINAARGCCSWHGGVNYCDSSVGSLVCNDGTYSPTCGCAYNPPARPAPPPTATPTPFEMNVQATYQLDPDTCKYNINAAWKEYENFNKYSVSAVKTTSTTCQEPGNISDTNITEIDFNNKPAGTYLINVKPGNYVGWNNYVYCNSIELPPIEPKINAKIENISGQDYLHYYATCARNITVDNGIGKVNAKEGKFKVDLKNKITYMFSSKSNEGKLAETFIVAAIPTLTPVPTFTVPQNDGGNVTGLRNILSNIMNFLFGE